ncbi:hypothetical protein ACFQU2_21610 [Siccirubricoccus deserti]
MVPPVPLVTVPGGLLGVMPVLLPVVMPVPLPALGAGAMLVPVPVLGEGAMPVPVPDGVPTIPPPI